MVRFLKEMVYRGYQDGGGGGDGYGEEVRLVFVLWAAFVTLSVFAAIIFFCADGVPKSSTKGSTTNNYVDGSACTAAGCGGAGCGGGCGG